MKTYKIHLIRHGMTEANSKGIYCGASDYPLSAQGERSLGELLENFDYPYVERVYSSPLVRATRTAEILFPGCDILPVDDLREASFGPFEGKSIEELRGNPDFEKFVAPGSKFVPAGVEPAAEFHLRCREAFIGIVNEMMRGGVFSAAVVTHAGVIGTILSLLAYPKRAPYDWQCDCGCGFTVMADPSLFLRDPVVEVIDSLPYETAPSENEDNTD
ncbi:MAG: histidine phosphatase family protein [Oscillospiraceae bacterium]|nr:histidine phosphatase family protein [Oscillospiraceae bacterium]